MNPSESPSEPTLVGALPRGTRLHEYVIDRVLGHGGFGITYLARDTHLDKKVAIKEYLPNDLAARAPDATVTVRAPETREAFQWGLDSFIKEARVLARFSHPNLIQVHRYFEANATAYFVMDYAEGVTLSTVLRHEGELSEERLRAILEPILNGLAEVHRLGVLHRDIKPDNIILRDGSPPVLIDFGAARQTLGSMTRSVMSVLTAGYAPIEQYASSGNQGPWTDLYAFGAVAYRALSGQKPTDAVNRIRDDPMVPAAILGRGRCSDHFLAAVDWALAVNPEDRPASVDELKAALDGQCVPRAPTRPAHGGGGPSAAWTGARPDSAHTVMVAKHGAADTGPRGLVMAGIAAGVLTVGVIASIVLTRPAPPSTATRPAGESAQTGGTVGAAPETDAARTAREARPAPAPATQSAGESQAAPEAPPAGEPQATRETPPAGEPEAARETASASRPEAPPQTQSADQSRSRTPPAVEPRGAPEPAPESQTASGAQPAPAQPDSGSGPAAPAEESKPEPVRANPLRVAVAAMKPLTSFRDCEKCPLMVALAPATFTMGALASDNGNRWEGPAHAVKIDKAFAVGRHEVTAAQWQACVDARACTAVDPGPSTGDPSQAPAVHVTWSDAQAYVDWLGTLTGRRYRLPTEAEWEYAIRAGTRTARYWGGDRTEQCRYGNGADQSAKQHDAKLSAVECDDRFAVLAPAGSFEPNAFGLFDMAGNAWEWTQDCWRDSYRDAPADGRAVEAADCERRVIRGGSWRARPNSLRSFGRGNSPPATRSEDLGLRVVAE